MLRLTKLKKSTNTVKLFQRRVLCGFLTVITFSGLIYYEYRKLNKHFSKMLDCRILDKDTKGPDYIYIKYHIYQESMLKMKRKQEENSKWKNVFLNPIGKWWKTFKHSIAWRLLNIAQNGDKSERFKAVRQLIQFDHLKDWDFRHLAQILDARTAASLAHSDCDQRWFIPVHMRKLIKNPKIILKDLNQAISDMLPHKCVKNFIEKYLITTPLIKSDDPEYIKRDDVKNFNEYTGLKEYCEFLLHITKHEKICNDFIKNGHLKILLELKKLYEDDIETLVAIAKCVTHISMYPKFVEDFFVTGWITTLVEWRSSPDIRLQLISAKAISNLDYDDLHYKMCAPNIYQLYPINRCPRKPKCDVIFVHGLLGGVFITWRQKNKSASELGLIESIVPLEEPILAERTTRDIAPTLISDEATQRYIETLESNNDIGDDWEIVFPDCPEDASPNSKGMMCVSGSEWLCEETSNEYTNCWPMDWLPEDFPDIRILAIDYPSVATEWSNSYSKYLPCTKDPNDLEGRSKYFLKMLSLCDIGNDRPIIWIGHSMGGIITKNILVKAETSQNNNVNRIAKNTNAIVFLGTPHQGSPLAKWKPTVKTVIAPSIEVIELEEDNKMLLNLHNNFMNLLYTKYNNINIVSFAEGSPTILTSFKLPFTIVKATSANINYGDYYLLRYDHLNMSKPFYRQSFLYQRIVQVIREVLSGKYNKND